MKTTRSATPRAKSISWVTTSIVMPSSASSRMTRNTSPTSSGSSALVASSKSITFGSMARARAIATRCCWPPDNWAGYEGAFSARPTRLSSFFALSSAVVRSCLRTLRRAIVTLSSTDMCANRLNDWNTMPVDVRARSRSQSGWVSSMPSTNTLPSEGVSSMLTQRRSVLLPDPDGPMMQTTSPLVTDRSIPRSTWLDPNRLCSDSMRTSWSVIVCPPSNGVPSTRRAA